MRTLTMKLAAPLLMAGFFIAAAAPAIAAARPEPVKIMLIPMTFNRIVVSGNVTVLITQRAKEDILTDRDYDKNRISIKKRGYTLLISSVEPEPITISISVKDLQRIDASGNAVIRTTGGLNVQHLQVFLKDSTRAQVKATTESLYTYLTGNADLKLSGSTQEHYLTKDNISRLNMENLVAAKITRDSIRTEAVAGILRGR